MIAMIFGVYLTVSLCMAVPYIVRYLIVSRRENEVMAQPPLQVVHRFSPETADRAPDQTFYMQKFLRSL